MYNMFDAQSPTHNVKCVCVRKIYQHKKELVKLNLVVIDKTHTKKEFSREEDEELTYASSTSVRAARMATPRVSVASSAFVTRRRSVCASGSRAT